MQICQKQTIFPTLQESKQTEHGPKMYLRRYQQIIHKLLKQYKNR